MNEKNYPKEYYEFPEMVTFKEITQDEEFDENGELIWYDRHGIMFQNSFICSCCGGVTPISEIICDIDEGYMKDFDETEWYDWE